MATLTQEEIYQKMDEFDDKYADFDENAFSEWLETIDSIEVVVSDQYKKISIKVSLDDFGKITENKMYSDYLNLSLMNKYKYSHVTYITYFNNLE